MIVNTKDIIKKIAEETGCTESEVKDIVHCFHNEWLKDLLSEFKYAFVLVEHLGLFSYRKNKYDFLHNQITKDLKKYRQQLSLATPNTNVVLINLWNSKIEKLTISLNNLEELHRTREVIIKKNKESKKEREVIFNNLKNESVQ